MHKVRYPAIMINRTARVDYASTPNLSSGIDYCACHNHSSFTDANVICNHCIWMYQYHTRPYLIHHFFTYHSIANGNKIVAFDVYVVRCFPDYRISSTIFTIYIIIQKSNFCISVLFCNIRNNFSLTRCSNNNQSFHYLLPVNLAIVSLTPELIP